MIFDRRLFLIASQVVGLPTVIVNPDFRRPLMLDRVAQGAFHDIRLPRGLYPKQVVNHRKLAWLEGLQNPLSGRPHSTSCTIMARLEQPQTREPWGVGSWVEELAGT